MGKLLVCHMQFSTESTDHFKGKLHVFHMQFSTESTNSLYGQVTRMFYAVQHRIHNWYFDGRIIIKKKNVNKGAAREKLS